MPGDVEDEAFKCICSRVILDAFWSRTSVTVSGHLREVLFIVKYAERQWIFDPLPRLGPFPLHQHLGMLQAMMVIMRSMEPGCGRGGKSSMKPLGKLGVPSQYCGTCHLILVGI